MGIEVVDAHPDDEVFVREAVIWNRRWGQELNGLYYDEAIVGPDGMSFQVFVTKDTHPGQMNGAAYHLKGSRDDVNIVFLRVPEEWLS